MPDEGLIVEARGADLLAVKFTAMASPCEVLFPSMSQPTALAIGSVAAQEAWRIERKFSRYRDDSVTARIHRNRGTSMEVDEETAALIDFSSQCFDSARGSSISRPACFAASEVRWLGSDSRIAEVDALLPLIGFEKLQWNPPRLLLPEGMELDFGGIGKEYAVDRAYELLAARNTIPFPVNFGGDLRANRPPTRGRGRSASSGRIPSGSPPIARSRAWRTRHQRDSRRYLLRDGVRYGHILHPGTGWPVPGAPRSVTVASSSCTEAGLLSTIALLHGDRAHAFLEDQGVRYWVLQPLTAWDSLQRVT